MPQAAEAIGRDPYLHVLLLGAAKGGKSTCTITTLVAAVGSGYVLCCGDKSGMAPAARKTKKFSFDLVLDENDMVA